MRNDDLNQILSTDKRQLSALRFPLNLDEEGTGNVMRFSVNVPSNSEYLSNGDYRLLIDPATGREVEETITRSTSSSLRRRFSRKYSRISSQIDLFMPAQIRTNYSSDWGQEELGNAGMLIDAGMGLSQVDSMQDASNIWDIVKQTVPEALVNTLAGAGSIITQLNLKGARKLFTQTAVNPYIEVLFNGIQNRTFSFTFKMIPRNQAEQTMIKLIVDEFKFHRAPELKYTEQSNYWLFPSTFDIQFLNREGVNPWIFKISTCALTNFSVDNSPEGSFMTHKNGSPYAVEMTLEFTELEQLTKKQMREGY